MLLHAAGVVELGVAVRTAVLGGQLQVLVVNVVFEELGFGIGFRAQVTDMIPDLHMVIIL